MPEQIEKLKAIVRELEAELDSLDDVDEQAGVILQEAMAEIQETLQRRREQTVGQRSDGEQESDDEPDTVMERLSEAAHQFEESHPTLTGILSRLIDGLGQMGI